MLHNAKRNVVGRAHITHVKTRRPNMCDRLNQRKMEHTPRSVHEHIKTTPKNNTHPSTHNSLLSPDSRIHSDRFNSARIHVKRLHRLIRSPPSQYVIYNIRYIFSLVSNHHHWTFPSKSTVMSIRLKKQQQQLQHTKKYNLLRVH